MSQEFSLGLAFHFRYPTLGPGFQVLGTGHPAPGARYQIQSDAEGWMLNTEDRGGVPEKAHIESASIS
jgi:hypothetical protein